MTFHRFVTTAAFFLAVISMNVSFAFSDNAKRLPFGNQLWQYNFYGIAAPDNRTIWVAGNFGTIVHTEYGGKIWKEQESTVSTELYDITFIDNKTGWCVGRHGVILKTTDGGNRWTRKKSETETKCKKFSHF